MKPRICCQIVQKEISQKIRKLKINSFWQSFCFEDCERTNSPLMETRVFLEVFRKAMKKLK